MTDCPDESSSQHYLAAQGNGFGPVRPEEVVLFAVFEKTDRQGNRLTAAAFRRKQLIRTEVSLARLSHISLAEFMQQVVTPLEPALGALVGIAPADTSTLRARTFSVGEGKAVVRGRSVCVVDRVTEQDFDAHAAIGFSMAQDPLTDKQKAVTRSFIEADIAETFGEIVPPQNMFPQTSS